MSNKCLQILGVFKNKPLNVGRVFFVFEKAVEVEGVCFHLARQMETKRRIHSWSAQEQAAACVGETLAVPKTSSVR